MYDITSAEKVYDTSGAHIGYVLKIAENNWLPLNLDQNNYSGPSNHDDAINIVKIKYANSEPTIN